MMARGAMSESDDHRLAFARDLDWEFSYVTEEEAFPPELSGEPWLAGTVWQAAKKPFDFGFSEYVSAQHQKEVDVAAVRGLMGRSRELARQPTEWTNALKLHTAAFSLPEFAATIGNLRAARFGRYAAWREASIVGALDELRHAQLQLRFGHDWLRLDAQFDWTHRLLHTENWLGIATRHFIDDLVLAADPVEFAIGTHVVLEAGFINIDFMALGSIANEIGDRFFESLITSIQSDEGRHAQVGETVLEIAVRHDRARVQYLLDKWFWRSARSFAITTGFAMDYLTPLDHRTMSFREHVEEWIANTYLGILDRFGLERPWFWDQFIESLDYYHHMMYASAYSYRASTWFDFTLPGPDEREWLARKYPQSWQAIDPVWTCITERWRASDRGNDLAVHSATVFATCKLCQLMLCGGTPHRNSACVAMHDGQKLVFCSPPCRWIYEQEPERYRSHRTVVERIVAREAPANWISILRYFGLTLETWGKDAHGGDYPWVIRQPIE
jgi:toluene monooxygenase system protein A